jgi:glycosyltransferase involved in cell wall biosynthesis
MSAQQFKVAILLATYNGEKFLAQQLDSLLSQSFTDFTVLVRDDGSTDETLDVIERYRQQFPEKFQVINEHKQNFGPAQNFGVLLQYTTADYIFFCDQDDIWVRDKVALSLEKIRQLEHNQTAVPCMVYSDMKSIDEHGAIMAESVWKQLELNPRFFTLNRLLVQNIPHGCTMVINKAMQQLALPVPKEAILHDHWIALLAAACGKHAAIDKPLVLLRNHMHNVTRKQTSLPDKLTAISPTFFHRNRMSILFRSEHSRQRLCYSEQAH